MSLLDKLNMYVWSFRRKFSTLPEYDFNDDGEIVYEYTPIQWTRQAIYSLVVSGIVGGLLGSFIAIVINSTFVELTLSPQFSTYLGIMLIILGLIILKRTLAIDKLTQLHHAESSSAKIPRYHIIGFALLNFLTGLACTFYEFEKIMLLSWVYRVMFLTVVGMGLSFGLTYAIVDFLNLLVGKFRQGASRPLVEFILQIYVVIFASLSMGASFGFLFGLFDYRQHWLDMITSPDSYPHKENVHLAGLVGFGVTLITGIFWGTLAGVANEYIQRVELTFDCSDQPVEFEGDI